MSARNDAGWLQIWIALNLIRQASNRLLGTMSPNAVAVAREDLVKAERLILAARRLEAGEPTRPAPLVELWIRAEGHWRHVETFDPASPQFTRSAAPADYACFEARRQGAQMMKADARIDAYDIRRNPH